MLSVIQIIALLQGLFLISVLLAGRKSYKKPSFILLLCTIFSILLFIVGDDENNLFSKDIDWFFFDTSLFITFLFLFVKYHISDRSKFNKKDLLFFIPNLLYFSNEVYEVNVDELNNKFMEVLELGIELSFLVYLILTIRTIIVVRKQQWMLFFIVPLVLLTSTSIFNEVLIWFEYPEIALFGDANFNTFTMITVAALFYMITMKLIIAPKEIILPSKESKYKSSGLNANFIEEYKTRIVNYMEEEKGYTNCKLSLTILSDKLNIPKQYISEILNVHLKTNFQDFVNGYRVNAFIECLQSDDYRHYAHMGIATECGFNSKSTFYSIFKKHKGSTPAEYQKSLLTIG